MPTTEEIKALVQRMPELDAPPPPPPEEAVTPPVEVKPKDPPSKDPAAKDKPVEPPKPKPKPKAPTGPKGTLTGPPWADAAMIYDAILEGGKESVGVVIGMVTDNDIGPAYKPRYVLHAWAVYACRPGHEKDRAAVVGAIVPELTGTKSKGVRGLLVRTLQVCGTPADASALAPLLADEDLCDAAAQAMTALGGDAAAALRAALGGAKGRARLAIVQALGAVRDTVAIEALTPIAADADETLRLAAVWALARSGDARAIDAVLKATDAKESWPRSQATRAAFALAESLAAAGKAADARRVYEHLADTRDAELERHVVEAARRGMK